MDAATRAKFRALRDAARGGGPKFWGADLGAQGRGQTVARLINLVGGDDALDLSVEVRPGLTVMVPLRQRGWRDRLAEIARCAQSIARTTPRVSFVDLVEKLMLKDGWVVSGTTLKTPGWMEDFAEVPIDEAERLLLDVMRKARADYDEDHPDAGEAGAEGVGAGVGA